MEELIKMAKKHDDEAFTQAILMIQNELYCIAKTRLKNEDDIADSIQETILAGYKNINKLRDVRLFKTWIIKILINKCNDIYQKVSKDISMEDEKLQIPTNENTNDDNISFEILIKNLSKEEKTILTLYYCSNYTTKEISDILKINEGTVRTKMMRAKEKIKRDYERGYKNEEY